MPLQANWHQNRLYLWSAEQTAWTGASADRASPSAAEPWRLAGPADLRAVLGEVSDDALLATIAAEQRLSVWLPCGSTGKDSHKRFIAGVDPSPPSGGRFSVIEAPSLAFSPADAIDLLTSIPDPPPECCGDSLRYWLRLARFVVERIAHRRFYPHLEMHSSGTGTASWRLLLSQPEEIEWLSRLAAAIPPVCRSVAGMGDGSLEPAVLVESFIASTADAIIRRDVANDPFFERIHQRADEPDAPPEARWLSALIGTDRTIKGTPPENILLAEQVEAWIGRLDQGPEVAPLRLRLELLEPIEDQDQAEPQWRLRLWLQAAEEEHEGFPPADFAGGVAAPIDPAALKPAEQSPGILGRSDAAARNRYLAELARAQEIFPLLERIPPPPAVPQMHLSTAEAHLFLRQYATLLEESGFAVTLPRWARDPEHDLGLELVLRPTEGLDEPPFAAAGTSGLGLHSLLEFDWKLAVGDLKLDAQEFRQLVEGRPALVRYRGQWLQIDPEAGRRALAFLDQHRGGRMSFGEAFRTALGAARNETGLPITGLSGEGWIARLLEQTPSGELAQLEQPPAFRGQLRPYQRRGLDWMAFLDRLGLGSCLADDMGLGKTIQLIALLLHERAHRSTGVTPVPEQKHGRDAHATQMHPRPTLLFAPTSVVGNWLREVQRFAPSLRVLVHHGPQRLRGDDFVRAAAGHDLVITSYSLAHRDLDFLRRPAWHRIALDEAQKIKNPSAASTIAIRSLSAPRRIALTGTPIENHLSELWSIMEVLNPGLLGPAAEFRERFAVPIEKLGDREQAHRLRRMIRPFVLRRTKSDPQIAGDLPEKMEMRVFCNLTPEQARMYEQITGDMLNQIDAATGIRRRGLILAALTRLKQVCNHPGLLLKEPGPLDDRSGKCERLVEMLEEVLEEGDAALVFTQFRQMGHLLERQLVERLHTPVQFLHGGTPAPKRDQMIQRFQKPGSDVRIFLLSLRAGGLGLNLTAANHVFHFDRWWNPAVEEQATDRAHRIGQQRKVQVHKFVCIGTMEERIDRLLSEKIELAEKIVGTGDEWLTNLSTDQLRDYLALSQDAVGEF